MQDVAGSGNMFALLWGPRYTNALIAHMPVFDNDDLPVHSVPRIKTRVLVDRSSGATATSVWEQWIHTEGFIPPHYHDVEEVLVILRGSIDLTMGERRQVVDSPATVLIPPNEIHELRPAGDEEVHLLAFFPVPNPIIYAPDGTVRPMPWEDKN